MIETAKANGLDPYRYLVYILTKAPVLAAAHEPDWAVGLLEISMAYSTFDVRYPQWTVEVDAAKCKRAGITPDAVLSTLSGLSLIHISGVINPTTEAANIS